MSETELVNQSETVNLPTYEAARTALAECTSIDDVKQIRDKAEAIRLYAKQARDFEMQNNAAAIRIRAERRMGEMLIAQKEAGGMNTGTRMEAGSNEPGQSHDKTAPTLAEIGISRDMSSRSQKLAAIDEKDFEKVVQDHIDNQEELTSITMRRWQARQDKEAEVEAIKSGEIIAPEGLFDVIVIDPPWEMKRIEYDGDPQAVDFDYPTMDENELSKLEIPAHDDCHVWMWTTHKHLPMAFRLLEAWGLKYVCTFVWHKNGGFQPFELPRYNCEFALYARRGTPRFIDLKAFPVCFNADRTGHSKKPDEFYDIVRRVTGGRRLDMFNRRSIDGFDGWGNEA